MGSRSARAVLTACPDLRLSAKLTAAAQARLCAMTANCSPAAFAVASRRQVRDEPPLKPGHDLLGDHVAAAEPVGINDTQVAVS